MQAGSLLTPIRLNENGIWAWNTSLPGDEESSQTVLDLASFVRIYFPVSDSMCVPLFF